MDAIIPDLIRRSGEVKEGIKKAEALRDELDKSIAEWKKTTERNALLPNQPHRASQFSSPLFFHKR